MSWTEEGITVLIALVTALGSSKVWDFWNKRQALALEKEKYNKEETNLYRDDLREEVKKLRGELVQIYEDRKQEVNILQKEISELREELAAFKTRVEFLEKENLELRQKLKQK